MRPELEDWHLRECLSKEINMLECLKMTIPSKRQSLGYLLLIHCGDS